MNSSKKKSRRVIRCRKKSSSISHISFSSAASGNSKRRISTLSKNNKALASALQDARCRLSMKESLLNDCTENFSKLMFSKLKMMKMYSTLKSFVKDFEEVLALLNVDEKKWPNSLIPHLNFEQKMKEPCFETIEEMVDPEDMCIDQEEMEDTIDTDDTILELSCKDISNTSKHHKFSLENQKENTQKSDKNITDKMNIENCDQNLILCGEKDNLIFEAPTPSWRESVEIPHLAKNVCNSGTDVTPMNYSSENRRENAEVDFTGVIESQDITPKLDLPVSTTDIGKELLSTEQSHSLNNNHNSGSESNEFIISENFAKERISKIPRLQDAYVKINESSNKVNKSSKVLKYASKKLDEVSEADRRGTFVVPPIVVDTDSDVSDISKCVLSLQFDEKVPHNKEISVENATESINDSKKNKRKTFVLKEGENKFKTDRRKTFVKAVEVKSDRRKTFVKALEEEEEPMPVIEVKKPIPIKDRRGTFTVPFKVKINEESTSCENSRETDRAPFPVNKTVLCNDDMEITEALSVPVDCFPLSDSQISKNSEHNVKSTEIRNNINFNVSKQISVDLDSQNSGKTSEQVLNFEKCSEYKVVIDNKNLKCDAENLNEDVSVETDSNWAKSETSQLEQISDMSFLSLSSDSDIDPIPDMDFVSEVSSIKYMPIRKHISKSKKVFVFNTDKRKSILKHSSKLSKLPQSSQDEDAFQSNTITSSGINIKHNEDVTENLPNVKKTRKSVQFDTTIEKIEIAGTHYSEISEINNDTDVLNKKNDNLAKSVLLKDKASLTEKNDANIITRTSAVRAKSNTRGRISAVSDSTNTTAPISLATEISSTITQTFVVKDDANTTAGNSDNILNMRRSKLSKIGIETISNATIKDKKDPSNKKADNLAKTVAVEENSTVKHVKNTNYERELEICNKENSEPRGETITDQNIHESSALGLNFNKFSSNACSSISPDSLSIANKQKNTKTKKTSTTKLKQTEFSDKPHDILIEENDTNSMKSLKTKLNVKRNPSSDDIVDENIPAVKRSKKGKTRKRSNTSVTHENEILSDEQKVSVDDILIKEVIPEKKPKRKKTNVNKKSLTQADKVNIVTYAEIHPPPSCLEKSPNKVFENQEEILKIQERRVSIVLTDVLESKNIEKFNISFDKDLLLPKCSTDFPLKTISSNHDSNNIAATSQHLKDCGKQSTDSNVQKYQISKSRRAAKQVSYKEPSLNVKMRR